MPRLIRRGDIWFTWVPKPGGGTRRVTTNCTDRRAAEKRASQLEREAVDPAYAAANQATVQQACDEFYLSRKRRGRSGETLDFYRTKLGHLVRLLPAKLSAVDASACEAFIDARLSEGAAQTTVKKEIRALGSVLTHAKRTGLYMLDIKATIPELEDTYVPRKRALEMWELVALANYFEAPRAAHLVFIAVTGARWGESLRARREDVRDDAVTLRGTKTKAAPRTVPVPPMLRTGLAWAMERAGDGLLFVAWGNVRRDLLVACKALGMAPVSPNDLRRSFASWLRAWGVGVDLIAAAMGHTTSRMVERVYGKLGPEELQNLIEQRAPAGLLMDSNPAHSGQSADGQDTDTARKKP